MLRERKTQQQGEYELVMLEELVPQDHFLRKVDAAVDFSFIHDMCKNLYCLDNGRPAIEPELLFKMLLLGYLYGIKSEIKLAQAVNENIAFKWFLGLKITEKGPDHATISANRVRRFRDNNIAEQIFDEILRQCILLFFPGQLGVELHQDDRVCVAHPDLKRFYRNLGVVAHRAEGDSEVVTADIDVLPRRELLSFLQQFLVLFRFAVPALMTPVHFPLKEADIGLVFPFESDLGHHTAVLLVTEKSVTAFQRFSKQVIQWNDPLGGFRLSGRFYRL